jgi:hypothetical protein
MSGGAIWCSGSEAGGLFAHLNKALKRHAIPALIPIAYRVASVHLDRFVLDRGWRPVLDKLVRTAHPVFSVTAPQVEFESSLEAMGRRDRSVAVDDGCTRCIGILSGF